MLVSCSPTPLRWVGILSLILTSTLFAALTNAAESPLIEITLKLPDGKSGVVQGKTIANDRTRCLLMLRDGEMQKIELPQVLSLKQVSPTFRPFTVMQLRDRLRSEYRGKLEVTAAGPFIVCGPSGLATPMAEQLDEVDEAFKRYFSRRNFDLAPLEFPLVVIVYPSRAEFVKQAEADLGNVSDSLRGYYSSRTNRTLLYAEPKSAKGDISPPLARATASRGTLPGGSAEPDPMQTLNHEAIHQLAYNYGLHSRFNETPRWLSEGLAMLMEEESMLFDQGQGAAQSRINRERLLRFQQYQATGREKGVIAQFVASNERFDSLEPLDAYSEAWALSFYLAENRPQDYARYLKKIASRDPFLPYDSSARVQDFQEVFGNNLLLFESRYLTFVSTLKLPTSPSRMSAK